MTLSPDLIANIIFGVIMTSIGIAALWAVRWQAFFLRRHQNLVQDEEQALRLSRTNSDASADGNDTLVLHSESTPEDRPVPFGARSQIPRSDNELTDVSVSLLDWSRLPF